MRLKWGEEYQGRGQADPGKTREQRRAEMQELLRDAEGKDIVAYYFLKFTSGLRGVCPPAGALMIETILNHEYPNG